MTARYEHHGTSHKNDNQGFDAHSRINRWAIDKVAAFAKTLDSIPEGNGTMLDNSIVCISYELGKGRGHDMFNVPHIIFGGAGGQYKTGQFLKYGDENGKNGLPVNKLLLSHCRALGVKAQDVATVGVKSIASEAVVKDLFI